MTKGLDCCRAVSCALAGCAYICTDRVVAFSADAKPATVCCCLVALIDHCVRDALEAERARENEQWDSAFGAAAPTDRKLRDARIIQIASARAFLSKMTKPP